jgi:1-acyl-sn-glycerol-3-phosphate acyltransferase
LLRECARIGGTILGWLCFVGIALVWGLLLAPLTALLIRVWPGAREIFVTQTHWLLWAYIRALPIARIEVQGSEQRLSGPRILVANHQSRLDSPVLLALEPRLCGPVRGYMLRVPLLARGIRLLGFFDTDTGEWESIEAMHRSADEARARGGGLLFYPEGTRSKDAEVVPFRRGAFRTAVDHDLPIQPVVIEGLAAILPPGHLIAQTHWRYPVRIRYLEPLHPPYGPGPRRDVVRALAVRLHDTIAAELASMRAERDPAGDRDAPDRVPARA